MLKALFKNLFIEKEKAIDFFDTVLYIFIKVVKTFLK